MDSVYIENLTILWKFRLKGIHRVPLYPLLKMKTFGCKYVSDGKEFVELSKVSRKKEVEKKLKELSKPPLKIKTGRKIRYR